MHYSIMRIISVSLWPKTLYRGQGGTQQGETSVIFHKYSAPSPWYYSRGFREKQQRLLHSYRTH